MNDYSNFPFHKFTTAQVFALVRESKELGDDDFVSAGIEAIRLNKCLPDDTLQRPPRQRNKETANTDRTPAAFCVPGNAQVTHR